MALFSKSPTLQSIISDITLKVTQLRELTTSNNTAIDAKTKEIESLSEEVSGLRNENQQADRIARRLEELTQ